MMNRWTAIWFVALAPVLVAGCGQSPETQLQTAEIAVQRGQYQKALELADKVLTVQPESVEAHLIRARAQIRLRRLEGPDSAATTLDGLLERQPQNADVHQIYIHWAFVQLTQLLEKSDYVNNLSLQEKFEDALKTGGRHADWLATQEGQAAEALYVKARLARRQVDGIDRILEGHNRSIERQIDDQRQNEQIDDVIGDLDRKRENLAKQIERYLREAIALAPDHNAACELYAAMLMERQAWPNLWQLSQRLIKQPGLGASLCDRMAVALIQMPTSYQPRNDRLEAATKIVGNAHENGHGTVDWLIATGRLHLVQDEHDEASKKFEQVLKQRPDDINGRYLLAQAFYGLKQYADAKFHLDKLSKRAPRSSDILTLYGLVLTNLEELAQAKDMLSKARAIDPENSVAQQAMFQIMLAEKRLDEVGPEIIKFYEANRAKPEAIRLLVQTLQSEGQTEQLRKRLDEVQTVEPLTAEHLGILVEAYFFLEDFRQVERFARQLAELQPDNLVAHLRLAEALLMLDEHEAVNQLLSNLRQRFAETASVDQMRGRLYLRRHLFDRAVDLLQKVVDSEPANHEARLLLARSLANLSNTDEAFSHINAILEEDPDHLDAHALAGRIYQFTGQEDKARKHLERIDVSQVDEYRYPALMAQIKINQGKLEDAANVCTRAIGRGHTDPALRLLLAGIYAKQEDYQKAEQHLLALARSQPRNPQAFGLLARFYVVRGDYRKGLDEFDKLQAAGADEALSRLARSMLLRASDRTDDALRVLSVIYEPLIQRGDRKALTVADAMAKIHLGQDAPAAALAVYEKLIEADVYRTEAKLRQVDIWIASDKIKARATLDRLAEGIGATQKRLRFMIMNRYVRLDRVPKALAMLESWMQSDGEHVPLLRWKGDLLMKTGKAAEAAAVYGKAIDQAPDSAALRFQLARAHLVQLDFPSAEAAFDAMAELDTGAKIAALAGKGQMFLKLGLKHEAVTVFDELERTGQPRDPRVIHAIGQAFADMGKADQARDRLQQIPVYAKPYVPAQLLLARVEQSQGLMEQAEKRLQELLKHRGAVATVVRELLELNIRNKQHEMLLSWAEQLLAVETLPDELKWNWLRLTVTINAERKDWGNVLEALEQLAKRQPNHPVIAASQIVVLLHMNRREQATEIYRTTRPLADQPIAPMIAMLLAEPIPQLSQESGVSRYLRALANQDIAAARAGAEQLRPHKTLFKSDLISILDRDDIRAPVTRRAARATALALVALEAGMYELSEQLSQGVIRDAPRFAPAHGVLVQAQLKMGAPVEQALADARRLLPGTGLALYLSGRAKRAKQDWLGCTADLKTLLDREPGNHHIEYELALVLQNAEQIDEVIPLLERISAEDGPYRLAGSNDLAYLLAEHLPHRLQEAYDMAVGTLKQWSSPHLHDTLGWIEHLRDDDEAALGHLCQAVARINDIPDIHYHLGVVYKALGFEAWARYHLNEAAEGRDRPWTAEARALLAN